MSRLPILFALLLALPAAAQTYRWVDKNGQVHYGQFPPKGSDYTSVGPAAPPSAAPNQDAINGALQESIESGPTEKAKSAEAAAERSAREARCRQARDGLSQLADIPGQRLFRTEADGTVSRVEEDEMVRRRAELERAVVANCG